MIISVQVSVPSSFPTPIVMNLWDEVEKVRVQNKTFPETPDQCKLVIIQWINPLTSDIRLNTGPTASPGYKFTASDPVLRLEDLSLKDLWIYHQGNENTTLTVTLNPGDKKALY